MHFLPLLQKKSEDMNEKIERRPERIEAEVGASGAPAEARSESVFSPAPVAVPAGKKFRKEKKKGSWVRENIEAVIVAVALALIIRQFAMEAFVIPTGSMAPTLYGTHAEVSCPNCAFRFAIDNPAKGRGFYKAFRLEGECPYCHRRTRVYIPTSETYSENFEACCEFCGRTWLFERPMQGAVTPVKRVTLTCPSCSYKFSKDLLVSSISGGHKLLVNKVLYHLREPQRWEVIVFKCPAEPGTSEESLEKKNYIKRLIALPGEEVSIRNGDIYINGKIARKPVHVQEEEWQEVYNSSRTRNYEENIPWRASDAAWTLTPKKFCVNAPERATTIVFDKAITSASAYNYEDNESEDVPDVGLVFKVMVSRDSGGITATLKDGEHEFNLFLRASGETKKTSLSNFFDTLCESDFSLSPGRIHTVGFNNVDDRVTVAIDGSPLFQYDYICDLSLKVRAQITLGAERTIAEFTDIIVRRDIYYIGRGSQNAYSEPYRVDENEYFVLGDNTTSSRDSRIWGTVPKENLLGRAFIIFWPPWQIRFIR
jgi:signal peptidase I